MQYKTITLERLKADPQRYRRLRQTRTLRAELSRQSEALKAAHLRWEVRLAERRPDLDPPSLRAAALEFALAEWEDQLARTGSRDDSAPA